MKLKLKWKNDVTIRVKEMIKKNETNKTEE